MGYVLYIVCLLLLSTICSAIVVIMWWLWWHRLWDWVCGMEDRAWVWVLDRVLGAHEEVDRGMSDEPN